jgi:hypothetical protein
VPLKKYCSITPIDLYRMDLKILLNNHFIIGIYLFDKSFLKRKFAKKKNVN